MKPNKLFLLLVATLLTLLTTCKKEDDDKEITKDFDQYDAEYLAVIIKYSLTNVAPYYSSMTWYNSKDYGSVSGFATVNGSFTEWSTSAGATNYLHYKYNSVSVSFFDYCDNTNEPHLTGNATMNGTLNYTYVMGNNGDYSGSWTFSGSLTCDGMTCGEASFHLVLVEENHFSGSLSFEGKSYQVSN